MAKFPSAINHYHYTYTLQGIFNSEAECRIRFRELLRYTLPDDAKYKTLKKDNQVALYVW